MLDATLLAGSNTLNLRAQPKQYRLRIMQGLVDRQYSRKPDLFWVARDCHIDGMISKMQEFLNNTSHRLAILKNPSVTLRYLKVRVHESTSFFLENPDVTQQKILGVRVSPSYKKAKPLHKEKKVRTQHANSFCAD